MPKSLKTYNINAPISYISIITISSLAANAYCYNPLCHNYILKKHLIGSWQMINNIRTQNVGEVLYFQKWIHEESLTEMMVKRFKKLRQICFAAQVKKAITESNQAFRPKKV